MIDIYGTLGPACSNEEVLKAMFDEGMTGIRINLSHVKLSECKKEIGIICTAATKAGVESKILIDMQGPELRIGNLNKPIVMSEGEKVILGESGIPVPKEVINSITEGTDILLDDGKILVTVGKVEQDKAVAKVLRGGTLTSRKSIALVGVSVNMPAMTETDIENIKEASKLPIYGVMQPFVRSKKDLIEVRDALSQNGCSGVKIFAKIENQDGVKSLETFMDSCDEIIIARGDLGNSMPLWELPKTQKSIAKTCREYNKPFMVVTQMLSSMEHSKVPTRAEVSDIYNSAIDGAASVMVTGETAIGEYPVEVIKYLKKTIDTV